MPKVRAVDEMNETELRAELVSLLADGFNVKTRPILPVRVERAAK